MACISVSVSGALLLSGRCGAVGGRESGYAGRWARGCCAGAESEGGGGGGAGGAREGELWREFDAWARRCSVSRRRASRASSSRSLDETVSFLWLALVPEIAHRGSLKAVGNGLQLDGLDEIIHGRVQAEHGIEIGGEGLDDGAVAGFE